ncbi:MAG TPA: GNAT family N-acetyltransferase [Coriobacteriia bacterium]|jgi:GNAT superfamily N-acetyltransferase
MAIRTVQAAAPDELDAVRQLFLEYAESLGWDLSQGGRLADEIADLPGPYAPPAGALLLACVDGEPAGALGLQPVPADVRVPGAGAERFGELKRLYVRPEHRRHGVGRALMERAETEARERGYEQLVLTTSAEMMPLAQRLYDFLGYEPTQVYRTDMPWPAIRWLRKEL